MNTALPATSSEGTSVTRRRFDPLLHFLYFRGAGMVHFLSCRTRPAGIALTIIFTLAACLGLGHERTSVYQLFSLSFGMMLVSVPWALSRRAKIEASRELPRFGTAGEMLRYNVRVRNLTRRRLKHAWLTDTAPDPRPSSADFCQLREPGEEERNPFDRRLAYFRWQWLLLGNRLFTGGSSREGFHLKKGQEVSIPIELMPLRRGVIRLDDLRLLLPDPFGLFQRCRKIKAPAVTLTVLPKRYPLPPIELPGGAAFKVSGEANTNSIGTSGEFVGLRDYRPGDPLRQIHWRSWARTGRPIVKELEDTFYPRYGLIVDTLSTGRTDREFEEVISLAASFAASFDTSESLLDLMFIKTEAHMVTAGRGVERAEKLLEVLASVSPERTPHFDDLARLVIRHRDDLTSCLVIFNGWNGARADFLRKLDEAGVVCVPLIIGTGPRPDDVPGHWLDAANLATELRRLPNHLTRTI